MDADLKEAMRSRDAVRLGVLRMLKSALKYAEIEKPGAETQMSESDAVQVIRKQVKQRQDSIESFSKGGRPELAAKETEELKVLSSYLPQQISTEELQAAVRDTIMELNAGNQSTNGCGNESLAGQDWWTRRWEDAEPGSGTSIIAGLTARKC